ncbi:alpha/beta hydrolase [Nocardioides euryhalodurans]|uniref:Alpha/beta hydrolase n=1 Tax=Nocardioides euryhalodurans TaxID=2518370 RepID=A0A4P7GMW2_9ACTN|nr:alpha/beta hydrolase [Nocardioides euryhalodurans]QBR93360.1 alpha/beta hydrolase [Nocardioides euryhalodurans]
MSVRERLEAAAYRTLMGLPAPAQRLLAGRPLARQGQTLACDVQLTLRLARLVREPGLGDLPVIGARTLLRRQAVLVGGQQPVGSVRDVTVGERPGRLYVPRGAADVGPLLVFLHGGGWVIGDLETHDPVCRFLAEQAGVRVLAVDYRLAPEHPFPAAHDDCVAAYRWVVEHAADLGADPERLAVGGDSAGGTLAATTAIAAAREGLPLAFQLLVYPGTDMRGGTDSRRAFAEGLVLEQSFMDVAKASYLTRPGDETDPRASPLLADLPGGLAPAYVATAGFDPLRDEGEAYARALAAAGVAVELRRFPEQVHGFVQFVGVGRTGRAANRELAAALATGLSVGVRSPRSA